jgi:hypothetical protein
MIDVTTHETMQTSLAADLAVVGTTHAAMEHNGDRSGQSQAEKAG